MLFPFDVADNRFGVMMALGGLWLLFVAGFWLINSEAIKVNFSFFRREGAEAKWFDWRVVWGSLFAGMLVFAIAYGWMSLTRHNLFNSTGYDLAINEQIVWNTLNGRFFASSVEVDNSFADHFRPMLIFLVPIYAIFQTPKTLLLVQVLVLASGAIPLYFLANLKLQNQKVALALAAVYLLYPPLGFIARFDFHIEVFVIPAFIAAFYMMETGRWNWASFFLVIPLLCKENMGFTALMFGLYAILRWRRWTWGIVWIAIGIFFTWFTAFWLLPTVRGEEIDTLSRYAWLGDGLVGMLQTMVTDPMRVINHLVKQSNWLYMLQLLLPLGLLPLLGFREFLLAVPAFGINLLSAQECQSTIYCHYAIPVIPIIFIAAVFGLLYLQRWVGSEKNLPIFSYGLIVLTLACYWVSNPFSEVPILPSAFEPIGNAEIVSIALAAVPADGVLVTTNDYAPHLAQREGLFIIGIPSQRVAPTDPDLVFLNLYDQQFIVCDQMREYITQLDKTAYGTTFRTGGLIVIQRDAGSAEQFLDFVDNWNNCAG
ncbi:MAG: DUF2079 domain-containing protein [Chloroflexota bacterium]